jgi:LysM repeat protein
MKKLLGLSVVLLTAFSLAGCATTQQTGASKTKAVPAETTEAATPAKKSSKHTIKIEKGQTLWSIAKSDAAYGKSCNWPLIFKANKGKVQDPDLIYPGQVLIIPRGVPVTEKDSACEAATKYGPYEPHSTPRQDVKLDF